MRLIADDALAAITIFQEAEGEPFEGKVAVAEVIRNRMARRFMSDGTVAGTVLRAFQFSGFNTMSSNRVRSFKIDADNPIVEDCLRAWATARMGSNTVKGADSYVNLGLADPKWARGKKPVASVGRHSFYRVEGD